MKFNKYVWELYKTSEFGKRKIADVSFSKKSCGGMIWKNRMNYTKSQN